MMVSVWVRVSVLVWAFAVGLLPGIALAQDDDEPNPTPPRLAYVDGEVSFWRPGAEDWVPAQVNTAIAEGDELYADAGGRIELQMGPRAFVRAGAETQIGLETLDSNYMQYKVTGGRIALDLKRLPEGQTIEIDTPAAAVIIEQPGYYRIDVDDRGTTFAVRRGAAVVVNSEGNEFDVAENQRGFLGPDDTGPPNLEPIGALDDWDLWNDDRTSKIPERPRSAEYVSPDVTGVDDLDTYGDWREEPQYGRVWVPRNVDADWAPYSTGRWVYDPYYEWTWVDEAPWGWAPYHYGRWVHAGSYWGWAPGPIIARPVYAPALVAFFGAPAVGVSVGVGAPFVSWCALGWGEPVVPWWGRRHFVGRPWWGGWGGPRIVNNVVINNVNVVNVRNINRYANMNVRRAVIGVERGRFGRGGRHVRIDQATARLKPMHGRAGLGIKPGRESFVAREGRGKRPPQRFQERKVVATRAPRDPMQRLRGKGVDAAPAPTRRAESRVVQPRGGGKRRGRDAREGGTTPETAPALGGGRDGGGRRGRDRPGMQGQDQGPPDPRRRRERQAGEGKRGGGNEGAGGRRQRDRGAGDAPGQQVPDQGMRRQRQDGSGGGGGGDGRRRGGREGSGESAPNMKQGDDGGRGRRQGGGGDGGRGRQRDGGVDQPRQQRREQPSMRQNEGRQRQGGDGRGGHDGGGQGRVGQGGQRQGGQGGQGQVQSGGQGGGGNRGGGEGGGQGAGGGGGKKKNKDRD